MEAFMQSIPGFQEFVTNRPDALSQVTEFIQSRPNFQQPVDLVPMDEYERRLIAIETILNFQRVVRNDRDWQLSALQFSVLLGMPLAVLEGPQDHHAFKSTLDKLGVLFNHFLQKEEFVATASEKKTLDSLSWQSITQNPAPLSIASEKSADPMPTTGASTVPQKRALQEDPEKNPKDETLSKKTKDIGRNDKERNKCSSQDHDRCVVTATGDAHVCHIIPFAWNKNQKNLTKTDYVLPSITSGLGFWINPIALPAIAALHAGLGSSDKAWNMLTLTPTLHTWWGSGFFGFKFMGKTPSESCPDQTEVQLQFRWMPRSRETNATRKINLQDQRDPERRLLADLDHHYGQRKRSSCTQPCELCSETRLRIAYDSRNHHRVASGAIFKVMRDTAFVEHFQVMIEIQWAIICAAAMSGAAQAPELLVSSDDDDDYAYWLGVENEKIEEWVRQVARSTDSRGESV
ncbi:hypothetical protein QQX98_008989 [Neonectria punicea]|uniref:HNH nuclease domain-containing protein n=1 Tax=Neonectria punicea TaxID=979145 RepID=A0ABR1GU41_9HYPO